MNDRLGALLKLAPLQAELFDQARNWAHAKKLDDALSEVETLLASAPGALAWFLFDPLPRPTLTEDGELHQVRPSIEKIELTYRADSFSAELKRLRNVCARAVADGTGTTPQQDSSQRATDLSCTAQLRSPLSL